MQGGVAKGVAQQFVDEGGGELRSIDVGFNVGYLLDVLNNSSSELIEWGFNDANSSALLTIPGNDRFKYVVMPMRI